MTCRQPVDKEVLPKRKERAVLEILKEYLWIYVNTEEMREVLGR